jgi:hypothetical protein
MKLGKLPLRYAAGRAGVLIPFVPEPSHGTTVPGVPHHEAFIAMRGDQDMLPVDPLQGLDAVEHALPGRPQLDLIDDPEQIDLLAVIPFFRIIGV